MCNTRVTSITVGTIMIAENLIRNKVNESTLAKTEQTIKHKEEGSIERNSKEENKIRHNDLDSIKIEETDKYKTESIKCFKSEIVFIDDSRADKELHKVNNKVEKKSITDTKIGWPISQPSIKTEILSRPKNYVHRRPLVNSFFIAPNAITDPEPPSNIQTFNLPRKNSQGVNIGSSQYLTDDFGLYLTQVSGKAEHFNAAQQVPLLQRNSKEVSKEEFDAEW
eukprot:TRINITY_DN3759_c0_g1_i2.p2 TRINITY_DN3759_c0_g1~~TRINITY_DN3759_c0_g1_i2.p2  ORF type:complete len:223 (-),score=21.51 TRINITY_DN3759_c0_g1_i2:144-812(-)